MQAAVVVFALTALGALAVSPRTGSTQDNPTETPVTQTQTQPQPSTYSDGYQRGFKEGKSLQQQQDSQAQQSQDTSAGEKGGCCGG